MSEVLKGVKFGSKQVDKSLQARIDEIYAQAKAARAKLQGSEASTWQAAKIELEADWTSLLASFQEWVAEIDEEYGQREA